VVSADFVFVDLLVLNVWDCRNGLVLFKFSGETQDELEVVRTMLGATLVGP
jgi:hypothetical protein